MTDLVQRATALDVTDPLAELRERYHIPKGPNGEPLVYLCGNSLGLQPKSVGPTIQAELDDWAQLAVDAHFDGANPWYSYHELFPEMAAKVVGALPSEIVLMGSLTQNLHTLMVSFYRPSASRYRILIDGPSFPSDRYAVDSQARFHGLDPADAVVQLNPRAGEHALRAEDIDAAIAEQGDKLALVLFSGVNYYTGQAYDLGRIAAASRAVGAVVGFDLAHAAGNVELRLHDWQCDFAAWCTYKYLNSGPGGVAGAFVHERHANDPALPRFAGWWGTDPKTRFEMRPQFEPQIGAAGWQVSNAPILSMAAHLAALRIFDEVGMPALRQKSAALTQFMADALEPIQAYGVDVITPHGQRGAQLSLRFEVAPESLQGALQAGGVVCDYRPPHVLRAAPTAMYNCFTDVARFVDILRAVLTSGVSA